MSHRSGVLPGLVLVSALSTLALGSSYAADAGMSPVSPEGLKLVPSPNVRVLYLREGADFSGYDKFAMLECYVAFRKNWKQDQNTGQSFRVTDSDIVRIKNDVAKEFRAVFVRELTAKGMTQVTAVGKSVLILRPAIINLDIVAPDTMNAARDNYSTSAGQATLLLEVFDSVTSELLARVIDTQSAGDSRSIDVRRSGLSNRADADKVLTKWADLLGTALQNARAGSKGASPAGKS
jgi:hypothetical protein